MKVLASCFLLLYLPFCLHPIVEYENSRIRTCVFVCYLCFWTCYFPFDNLCNLCHHPHFRCLYYYIKSKFSSLVELCLMNPLSTLQLMSLKSPEQ